MTARLVRENSWSRAVLSVEATFMRQLQDSPLYGTGRMLLYMLCFHAETMVASHTKQYAMPL